MEAALPTGLRGRILALAITLVALACLWLGLVAPALDWFAGREEQLAQRRALAGRMEILAESVPGLRAQAQAVAARGPAPRTLVEGASDAVAGATLQESIQAMAARAGAQLASVETLPGEQAGAYRRIGVRLSMTTSWPVLVQLLQAIEQATPRMLVDDLQIQSSAIQLIQAPSPQARPMSAFFTVFAFRAGAAPANAGGEGGQ